MKRHLIHNNFTVKIGIKHRFYTFFKENQGNVLISVHTVLDTEWQVCFTVLHIVDLPRL